MPPPPAHGSTTDSDNILINLIKQFLFAHSQVRQVQQHRQPEFSISLEKSCYHCLPADELEGHYECRN